MTLAVLHQCGSGAGTLYRVNPTLHSRESRLDDLPPRADLNLLYTRHTRSNEQMHKTLVLYNIFEKIASRSFLLFFHVINEPFGKHNVDVRMVLPV